MRSNLHRKSLSICRKLFPHGGLRAAATECSFVLVFCLCFFATSAAFGQCPMGNQIVNPGNEAAPLNFNGTQQGSAPSWTVTSGNFGGLSYGADFFGLEILPVAPPHSPGDRGNNVFYGGNAQTNSSATQVYNVPAACQAEINTPGINYSVSGWFGGYAGQDDRFRLVVTFRDATNAALATVTIGDVLAIERGNDSGLRLRNAFGRVPPGTTSILFTLESTYAATDVNNAYADSLAFIFVPTTAAAASLSGRVTNAGGRGIARARVVLFGGSLAQPIYAQTNAFGYYRFPDLPAGTTYVVTVSSKTHTFAEPSRAINLDAELTNVDFVSQ
jgi:hypothetical protein